MSKLNHKQMAFVREYTIDLNATQAAIRAGYSPRSANVHASRMLTNANILEALANTVQDRAEKTGVDAAYVLSRLAEIDRMDVIDIMADDGSLKRLSEWPKIWRQYVSGIDLAEMIQGSGDERVAVGVLKKIKWPDKVKNLELLGKHVNVQAFRDKISNEHTGADGGPIKSESKVTYEFVNSDKDTSK
jgi:phage terminase small subunit